MRDPSHGEFGDPLPSFPLQRGKLPCFCPVQAHSHVGPKMARLRAVVIGFFHMGICCS